MRLAELLQFDRRAIRRMQHIRNKYAPGPLLLWFPGRSLALILDPEHVRVLAGSPEPFATASAEKRAALVHFEHSNVLISSGGRRYNEQELDAHDPLTSPRAPSFRNRSLRSAPPLAGHPKGR